MSVLLQAFYQHDGIGVPSSSNGDPGAPAWWDHLAAQANALRRSGFTAVWLPPVTKGKSGALSIGYDVFDDYDLGAKNQKGSVPTRYGTRQQLQRCAAVMRANGLEVFVDLVDHQRAGGHDFTYRYAGANGAASMGRFPKDPPNFHPQAPPEPNVVDRSLSFGDDLAPITGKPKDYIFNGLIDAADWLTRALDLQGYRFDDAKGTSTDFSFPLFTEKSMKGKFVVGEFFDRSVQNIGNWVFGNPGMRGVASAFDFPLRFLLANMCDSAGNFNMSSLDGAGFTSRAPLNSVTFVENHDTDAKQPIVSNKMLGYAFILTIEGFPSVYYRDYSTDANCFGLKPQIDTLIWIHENIAQGGTIQRWKDFQVFAYERLGGDHLLTALNNDPRNAHTITVDTGFGPNVRLHDYTGHSGDVFTDGGGRATIAIPHNVNGQSYVCYSRAGITADFAVTTHRTTQEYEGAADLDIPPASTAETVVARIWARSGTAIHVSFRPNAALPPAEVVTVTVSSGENVGPQVGTKDFSAATVAGDTLDVTAAVTAGGFHRVAIKTSTLAALPFVVGISYEAQQSL